MTPLAYVARIEPQELGGFLVVFPDVPEALTEGQNVEDAIRHAEDALAVALEGYLQRGREFPARSNVASGAAVIAEIPIRPVVAARWLLRAEMRRQNLDQAALGRLMGWDEKTIRRMVEGKGANLQRLLEALRVLGIRVALAV